MTSEERETLKLRLQAKIDKMKHKISRMEEMTKPISPENSIGRVSRMDAINNKSVMEAALRTARKDLDGMQVAIKHVDDADFGFCAKCKQEIPYQRLLLMPGSPYCVHCA
jgi:DnaK suppressor protein